MDGRKKSNVKEREDIFSKLPDTIVHDILSLLPTKDAVRTSVLSRRWLSLWTYSTNIDLNSDNCLTNDNMSGASNSTQQSFVDIVERILRLCDAPYLEKLRLTSIRQISAFCVSSWISFAITHRVQKLDLNLASDDDVVLPSCFFSCKSLTAVKVRRSCFLRIPSSICLPNLKTLHLTYATFLDEQSTQQFFSSLPVLQELVLHECVWSNMRNVTINSLTLKSLSIAIYEPCECEINIYASNLSSFHCEVNLDFELPLFLHDMELLVDAFVDLWHEEKKGIPIGMNLFHNVQCVKSLSVSDTTLMALSMTDNLEVCLPIFKNLNRLVVKRDFDCYAIVGLTAILERSPNLEFLDMEGLMDIDFDEFHWSLNNPRWCMCNLKKLRIFDFTGNEGETDIIKFMLKNFPLLENIELIRRRTNVPPRGSSSCVVEMS